MNTLEILEKLISFPILGGESNLTIITWIKEYIEEHGVETVLVPNKENTKSSLHCRVGPPVDGGVILSGHTDVVPVKGQKWDTDPFELIDEGDDKLYARGSADMKGFLACFLSVLPKMIDAKLQKPIYFAFSYDEEIGCLGAPDLIAHIKSHYAETPKYAIIGEPSLLQPIIGQKGICYIKTEVKGSEGHSSAIHREVSAIHESARLIIWLENKMHDLAQSSRDERFDPPHSTMHVGQIHGGIATNVVADKTYFEWDIRIIPKDSFEEIFKDFKAYCKEREHEKRKVFPDFKIVNTQLHPYVPALDTKPSDDIVVFTQNLVNNETWSTVAYGAEAGQFQKAGFKSIICGPNSIEQAHRANEFATKEQLDKGVQMIERLVEELT